MDKEFELDLKSFEITKMNEQAENAVAVAVAATAVTGAVPLPFADAPLLIAEQVTLMGTICSIYDINIGKDGLKMLATTAIGAGGAAVVGKTIATNLIKLIPGAGTVAGGVISAGTAGIVTYAMGMAFIEVCNMVKVGKLSEADITSDKGTSIMKEQFRSQVTKQKTEKKVKYILDCQGFGVIKKVRDVVKDGKKGILVWDYLVVNEITFVNASSKKSESLYKGWNDEKTEKEFERLSKLYAPKQ